MFCVLCTVVCSNSVYIYVVFDCACFVCVGLLLFVSLLLRVFVVSLIGVACCVVLLLCVF